MIARITIAAVCSPSPDRLILLAPKPVVRPIITVDGLRAAKCRSQPNLQLPTAPAVWEQNSRHQHSQWPSVIVRINDRGPYGRGRIIDVNHAQPAN